MKTEPEDWYTPAQAAELLKLSVHTLASWRTNHPDKLPFFRTGKVGGRVRYFKDSIERFRLENTYGA